MEQDYVQIRHKHFGLFQGEFLGLCFWWPLSEMPEQGICKLTKAEAESVIDNHMLMKLSGSELNRTVERSDFSLEPYDKSLSEDLQSQSPTPS